MAVDAHVGEVGVITVIMKDAQGNVTTDYDVLGGVQYSSTNPAAVAVTDEDANPTDAHLAFQALSGEGEDVFIDVSFDGRVGPEEHRVNLRSEAIRVVPGAAVAGEIQVAVQPI
jgi:hypothetical protein